MGLVAPMVSVLQRSGKTKSSILAPHAVGASPLRAMDSPAKLTPNFMWSEARKHFRINDDRRQPVRTPEYRQGIAESKQAIVLGIQSMGHEKIKLRLSLIFTVSQLVTNIEIKSLLLSRARPPELAYFSKLS